MLFCGTQFGYVMDQTKAKNAPCYSLKAEELRQKQNNAQLTLEGRYLLMHWVSAMCHVRTVV